MVVRNWDAFCKDLVGLISAILGFIILKFRAVEVMPQYIYLCLVIVMGVIVMKSYLWTRRNYCLINERGIIVSANGYMRSYDWRQIQVYSTSARRQKQLLFILGLELEDTKKIALKYSKRRHEYISRFTTVLDQIG